MGKTAKNLSSFVDVFTDGRLDIISKRITDVPKNVMH